MVLYSAHDGGSSAKGKEALDLETMTFGAQLKRYRMAARLTQEALAERANLSTRAISDLERGLSRAPRYDTLDQLSSAMNLSTQQRAALFGAARPALPEEDDTKIPPLQMLPIPLPPIPLPPTALLGREPEVSRALELLLVQGVRLLTLTGPGGVGKTRLALELTHPLRSGFADGLGWVDLSALRNSSLVPQTVAQVLGLREQADQVFQGQVLTFLQDKQFLLLLDNFEQVPQAADFVADLLVRCPRLQVLVTSRMPLHLRAEHLLVLNPLTQVAAVALFRERAHRLQPDLEAPESGRSGHLRPGGPPAPGHRTGGRTPQSTFPPLVARASLRPAGPAAWGCPGYARAPANYVRRDCLEL